MDWSRRPADWPHPDASALVESRPHHWHVQRMGRGPHMLLIHGAGGATQSFRGLLPILARRFDVIAPDLPGQGFTRPGTRQRCGLVPMAEDLRQLCRTLGIEPRIIVGHSAGAALALQMAATGPAPDRIVGINAALGSFESVAGWLFPLLAKALASLPGVPRLFARLGGTDARVAELLRQTGSDIDADGRRFYRALVGDPDHVEGTLAMMAQWDVRGLRDRLPALDVPTTFLAATGDRTVPPRVSAEAVGLMPDARLITLDGLGHLAHEEAPERVAELIFAAWSGDVRAS